MIRLKIGTSSLHKGSSDVLSVEVTVASLRLVHIRAKGKQKEVVDCSFHDINGVKEEEAAQLITKFIQAHKLTRFTVILTIPSHLVISKNIEVPSQDPQEIADIMNLQASRHTPYARDEITIDYLTVGAYRKSYTKILLVIVTREAVAKQLMLLRRAQLEVEKVCLSSEALGVFSSNLLNLAKDNFPVGLLHIDTTFSYFTIVYRKTCIFARSIPIGMYHLREEKERYTAKFVEEVKKSIEVYRSEDIEGLPQKILLLEDDLQIRNIEPLLCEAVGVPTESVSLIDALYARNELKEKVKKERFSVYIDAVASGLSYEEAKVDLIPEEVKLKRHFEQKSKELIKTGVFSLAALLLVVILFASKISFENLYLEQLKEKADTLHEEALALEAQFRRIQLVKKYLGMRGYSLEILDAIYANIPENMRISEVRLNRENQSLSIKGMAESAVSIYSFYGDLRETQYFKDIKSPSISQAKEGKKEVQVFTLLITLADTLK